MCAKRKCCYESFYQFSSDDEREKVASRRRIILRKKGGNPQDAGVEASTRDASEGLDADTETMMAPCFI